jgi:ABC-type branched-subunit amino acid transport system substrate-binding protein/serine/threonine protein kinase
MADTQPLLPGDPERLGDYELTGRLGEGGQGIVFLGRSPAGEQVAVKLLLAQLTGDAAARNRFVRELAVTKRVAGFCTAEVLDADVAGDRPYIVSEYVEGPSLRELVRDEGPRRGSALMRLAIGTATALAAIHQQGIVHRDFKPPNVLMGPDGPRVIDFGVARALDANAVTMTSQVVGTPAYMAPEQVAGGAVGAPADMFAWGATIAYAATGDSPFGNDSIPAVMHRIMHVDPDLATLPEPLRELVARCLSKNPAQRPTAHAVLLRLVGGVGGPAPAPDSRIEPALAQGAQLAVSDLPSSGWQHSNPPPPSSTTGPQGRTGPGSGPHTGPRGGPPTAPPAPPSTTGPQPGSPATPPGRTRRRRTLLLALAAPLAVLLVVGVVFAVGGLPGGEDNPGGGQPTSVKIGFAGALTGTDSASFGQPMLNGARLAVNEYNATNPAVRAELVPADTQGAANLAPAAVQKLFGAGVVGVVGPLFTGEAQATGPLFEQAQIPSITTAATGRSLSGNGWRFWHRLVASDKTVATSAADFIARAARPQRVLVVDDEAQYTRDVAGDVTARLEDRDVDVDTARISSRGSDYSAAVGKISSFGADVVFYGGPDEPSARLIKQAREADVDAQFVLSDPALSRDLVPGAGGAANAEDTLITCSCFDASQGTTQPAKDFRQRYQRAFGSLPGYYTAEGYDAALAFLAAVKAGGTTSAAINQHLTTVDITGASRKVRFGAGGDAADAAVYVYRVQNNRIVLIGDTKTANL